MQLIKKISVILAYPLVLLVILYQKTLSPDHSWVKMFYPWGYCKFHPTCSVYAVIVLKTQGLIGLPKIINRLARCNPSSLGGVDWPYDRKHL